MHRSLKTLLSLPLALACAASAALAGPIEERLATAFGGIDARALETGVLYNRVLGLSGIERFDGRAGAPSASLGTWRQLYEELRRAAADPSARPTADQVEARGRARSDAIPIALVFDRYERIRRDAVERGALVVSDGRLTTGRGEAFERHTAFAAAALRPEEWRGAETAFVLSGEAFFSNAGVPLSDLEVDLDDGRGFRRASFDTPVVSRYTGTGPKTIRVRARAAGESLEASTAVIVRALAAPLPNDTLHVTGRIPYLGGVTSGDAYVYLAASHSTLQNPIVVVEGFDLDNTYNWDELYAMLNQQQLLETLRADNYDIVVLNFADATDYMQRNGLLLVELLQELQTTIGPQNTMALAGASMGGLVSRYALAYMETNAIPHGVRTYLSFDAPHLGVNIPLGIQYWVRFFSSQSSDAARLLSLLDRPAARQMLVYHYTNPAGTLGRADPLRATFLADLAAVGDWPMLARKVGIANGAGNGVGEPFAAGAQIIKWSYSDLFVSILGNVWAVPNKAMTKIFDGHIRIFITGSSQSVTLSGTLPYDNAPGGWKNTMAQMDQVPAPYGNIIAYYPNHCFVPTVSALAFDTTDLFHDVMGDPDPLSHTPFDAIYAANVNQDHVTVSPENAVWIKNEVELGVTGVSPTPASAQIQLGRPSPNPSSSLVRVPFTLSRGGAVDVRVLGVDGREVSRLAGGVWHAGSHSIEWNGMDRRGVPAPPGVYFVRLAAEGKVETRRLVRLF